MIRIICGIPFEVESGTGFNLKVHPLGSGHMEITASRERVLTELDWSDDEIMDYQFKAEISRFNNAEERRLKHLQQACKRAKTRVRRLCKVMGADTLLTLTYRACEGDLARVKADLKEFNRRMLRVLPGFAFIAAFEKQERGAWHMHLATKNIPGVLPGNAGEFRSFNVIRAVWRSVTGDRGGNIDIQRRKKNSQKSAAQIASYIAAYIAKEFIDGEKWVNRYTCFGCTTSDIPKPIDMGRVATLLEALDVAYGCLPPDAEVNRMFVNRWHDLVFISSECGRKKRPLRALVGL